MLEISTSKEKISRVCDHQAKPAVGSLKGGGRKEERKKEKGRSTNLAHLFAKIKNTLIILSLVIFKLVVYRAQQQSIRYIKKKKNLHERFTEDAGIASGSEFQL